MVSREMFTLQSDTFYAELSLTRYSVSIHPGTNKNILRDYSLSLHAI